MRRQKSDLVLILLALAVMGVGWSCAPRRGVPNRGAEIVVPMRLVELTTGRGVEPGAPARPLQTGDRFHVSEPLVTCLARFQHGIGAHRVQFKWYGPGGELYASSDERPIEPPGRYHEFVVIWHSISIGGEMASRLPGLWRVTAWLDGAMVGSSGFEVYL
ncbi:MAG: hypothetical protein HYV63_22325 [Candidatus Schekmanbacteria bacterium]|nr:hypothetical protein [Candidatus Schekmanbacteria bacterium]